MLRFHHALLGLSLLSTGCVTGAFGGTADDRDLRDDDAGTFVPSGEDAAPTRDGAPGGDAGGGTDAGGSGEDTATVGDDAGPKPPPSEQKVVAYFAEWAVYGRNFHITDVDASLITHLNYAFLNIAGGECVLGDSYADIDKFYPGDSWDAGALRGSFHQLQLLKAKSPHLKTLLSIGGWTWSSGFSDAALTDASRTKLAKSCVAIMTKYGFDGLDLDWEYPGGGGLSAGRPEDKQNFTALLAAFRKELDAAGKGHLLTVAVGAAPSVIANLELAKIHPYLDSVNVMTYDFHGAWEKKTGHNSPLHRSKGDTSPVGWDTDAAARAYVEGGVPASKVIVGAAFYGRGWSGVPATNDGLFQPATGPSPGTFEQGILDYHDIAANYLPTFTRKWDGDAKVPWLYSAARQIMISYDDAESLKLRAQYVDAKGLGGVMVWELSGDDKAHSLGRAIRDALK
ncbi:MAG: glycoside hydrolase family 18 protein [Deltaproteobacteria bacterium]|nr:glycoside hydrolase family 18 protein [Deltaproteobacteria bacterium]